MPSLLVIVNAQFGGLVPQLPTKPLGAVGEGVNLAKNAAESLLNNFGDYKVSV